MKYDRLKKNKEISRVLKSGKRVHGDSLTVVYLSSNETRMAVCVGKKYGKSVQRNRVKRLLREAFRQSAETISFPCEFLLIPKIAQTYEYSLFLKDLVKILKKERLIETQTV